MTDQNSEVKSAVAWRHEVMKVSSKVSMAVGSMGGSVQVTVVSMTSSTMAMAAVASMAASVGRRQRSVGGGGGRQLERLP